MIPKPTKTTILWQPGSSAITIRGKWQRQSGGEILAEYTADELQKCLEVARVLDLPFFTPKLAKQTSNNKPENKG